MKALSLKPPWPYAVFHLDKDIENRTWRTTYTGPLFIHASKTWDDEGYRFIVNELGLYVPSKSDHVFGALIGTVNITGYIRKSPSKWFFGPWGWVMTNQQEFYRPVPWKGSQGLFDVHIENDPKGFLRQGMNLNLLGGDI